MEKLREKCLVYFAEVISPKKVKASLLISYCIIFEFLNVSHIKFLNHFISKKAVIWTIIYVEEYIRYSCVIIKVCLKDLTSKAFCD